jgi:hypothetical protein
MATLWIREYNLVGKAGAGKISAVQEPGTDQTPVTFSTSAQSAAFGTETQYIAIIGSAAFHYLVAANPTATTNHLKVPADTLFYIGVTAGQKIAAIAAA